MKIKTNICITLLSLMTLVGCVGTKPTNTSSTLTSSTSSELSNSTSVSVSTTASTSTSNSNSVIPSNPTITVVDDFRININEHVNYLSLVRAVDEIDGNITHLVTVDLPDKVEMINGDLYFEEVGTYNIVFNVTNSSGLSSNDDVNIEVYKIENKDFTGPTILGYKDIRVKSNEKAFPLEGVTAIDDVDGDVTSLLTASYITDGDATNGISFEKEGKYTIIIKAKDLSNNYSQVLVTIDVNNEVIPTAVDITDLLIQEYNCNVGDSGEVPFAGAKSTIITLKHNSESIKYANAKFLFTPNEDLNNKTFSFFVKVGSNVTDNKLGIYLMGDGDKLASLTIKITPTSSNGYSIEDKGNGWHLVTIAINKQWSTLSSYIVDSIRLSFSNVDVTQTATVYIANATLDNYKDGDINNNPSTGGGDTPLPASDLSDKIIKYNDFTTVTTDNSVSHDGVQSIKIKGENYSINQYTQAKYDFETPISVDNLNISFYVKLDGAKVRSNRIIVRVAPTSGSNIDSNIYLTNLTHDPGVTVSTADENGWYKITLDCNTLEYDGKTLSTGATLKYLRFTFEPQDKDTAKVIEPIIWIDELTYSYVGNGNIEEKLPDLSDKITHSSNTTISLDTEVSHDGVQSAKITGTPATGREDYSLAFYYGSATLTETTKISFYAKLGEGLYNDRVAFRIYTKEGAKLTNNIKVTTTNPISGVTCTPDVNGWYHVVVDVASFKDINDSTLTAVGGTLEYLRFGIIGTDRESGNATIVPIVWIDELTISGGVA